MSLEAVGSTEEFFVEVWSQLYVLFTGPWVDKTLQAMTAGSSLARNQSVFLPVITSTELYNMLLKRPLLSRGYQTAVELL